MLFFGSSSYIGCGPDMPYLYTLSSDVQSLSGMNISALGLVSSIFWLEKGFLLMHVRLLLW